MKRRWVGEQQRWVCGLNVVSEPGVAEFSATCDGYHVVVLSQLSMLNFPFGLDWESRDLYS